MEGYVAWENVAWLQGLKVGDKVAIIDGWEVGKRGIQIRKVIRITKTMIIVLLKEASDTWPEVTVRFSLKNGREVTDNIWHYSDIVPVSDEILAEIRKHKLLKDIEKIVWDKCSVMVLEAVLNLVPFAIEEKKG